ncbi:hypothetical protein [Thiolapillus sp.]
MGNCISRWGGGVAEEGRLPYVSEADENHTTDFALARTRMQTKTCCPGIG